MEKTYFNGEALRSQRRRENQNLCLDLNPNEIFQVFSPSLLLSASALKEKSFLVNLVSRLQAPTFGSGSRFKIVKTKGARRLQRALCTPKLIILPLFYKSEENVHTTRADGCAWSISA